MPKKMPNISETDKLALQSIGVNIDGQLVRVQDNANKVTHEFKLDDLAQLFIKRKFNLSKRIKNSKAYALVVCTWEGKRVNFYLNDFELPRVKDVLKRLNMFFYHES